MGDRFGRKRALELAVFLMAIPTSLVGLLPAHHPVGVAPAALRRVSGGSRDAAVRLLSIGATDAHGLSPTTAFTGKRIHLTAL